MSHEYEVSATFMGFPVQGFSIDRKPGLTSDTGYIDLPTELVKNIIIDPEFRLWQSANIKEPAGPFNPETARKLSRPTVFTEQPAKVTGLVRGGNLRIITKKGTFKNSPVNIGPLFIAPGGIEELQADLENALAHNEGDLRVNVVDFRHFWQRNGTPVLGEYNIPLENGKFDDRSINQRTKKPWTLPEIMLMITRSLPGSPSIESTSDIFDKDVREPVNLNMELDLPVEWLSRLLFIYDMEMHLSLNSTLFIKKRGRDHKVRRFRDQPSNSPKPLPFAAGPNNPNEEKKTVFMLDRPEAVLIVGSRRHQRVVSPYLPAYFDTDGTLQALASLPTRWGYSLAQAFAGSTLKEEKAYMDMPGADDVREARMEIARRDFFKVYAPAYLFASSIPLPAQDGGLVRITPTGVQPWPFERGKHELLPMLDPHFLPGELAELNTGIIPTLPTPANPKNERLIKVPIIVRANRVGQGLVTNIAELKQIVDAAVSTRGLARNDANEQVKRKERKLKQLLKLETDDDFRHLGKLDQFLVNFEKNFEEGIIENLALVSDKFERVLQFEADTRARRETSKSTLNGDIEELKKRSKRLTLEIAAAQAGIAGMQRFIEETGNIKLWTNFPWGYVDSQFYSIDTETGVITFRDICGTIAPGAIDDLENAVLVGDGNVELIYETESRLGVAQDFSSWCFLAPKLGSDPETARPILVKISEITSAKPMIIKDPELIIYENDSRQPLNIQTVTEKAARIARPILVQPTQQTGFSYVFPGCWKVITDDAVNAVTWNFDGDQGHTLITANNPDMDIGAESLTRKQTQEKLIYGR